MLKTLVDSDAKRVIWSRVQPLSLHRLSRGLFSDERHANRGEDEAFPVRHLFSKFYSHGSKYNKKGAEGKGPPTVRQRRIASEVKEVISEALQQGPCQNPLLQRCGFQIQNVKMSSDLRVAHVLWTALPGMQQSAEKAAISKVKRLRSLVFERLNLPFSPSIKFQEDKPSQEMLALDEAFAKLKESESKDPEPREAELEAEKTNSSTAPS